MPDQPAKPHRPLTIYDVAEAAGVSAATVSRTFARPGRVNAETAERIRRVAAELGYRVNPTAQALPTGRTCMIAVVVSDVTNPFYAEIIRGVQHAATEAGYNMLLLDAQESGRREREMLERTLSTVEGIVLATSRMPDLAIRMIAKQRPTIVLNRKLGDVPSVVTDNPLGMRRAVEHLGELGHDRIAYVAGPEASWADGTRWQAAREAGLELGVHVRRIGAFEPTVAGGASAATELLDNPASAVIAYNDLMAVGLIRALTAAGVRIPRDMSVVGFDNIFAAELVTPALTTVAAPLYAMGTTAVRQLLAMIRGTRLGPAEPAVVPSKLVVRASTAHRGWNRPSPAWRSRPVRESVPEATSGGTASK